MTITVLPDASLIHGRTLRPDSLNPLWTPSAEDWTYDGTLRAIAGTRLHQVSVVGGIGGHVYALLPEDLDFGPRTPRSKIVALAPDLCSSIEEVCVPIPKGLYADHPAAAGYAAVRILSPWTDGFIGYTPRVFDLKLDTVAAAAERLLRALEGLRGHQFDRVGDRRYAALRAEVEEALAIGAECGAHLT